MGHDKRRFCLWHAFDRDSFCVHVPRLNCVRESRFVHPKEDTIGSSHAFMCLFLRIRGFDQLKLAVQFRWVLSGFS